MTGLTGCDGPTKKLTGDVTNMSAEKVISLEDQTMVLDEDGNLWATGQNVKGEFGNETLVAKGVKQLTWVKVAENVKDFGTSARATGWNTYSESSTIIVKENGTLWVSGSNGYGQLGNSDTTDILNFTQVAGITNAVSVAVGNTYALYIDSNGDVYGSGDNSLGQLGLGTTTSVSTFTKIDLGSNKASKIITNTQVDSFNVWGLDAATTGITTTTGKLLVSGINWWNQIGGAHTHFTDTGLSNVTSVAMGPMNTYVISGGKLYGIGDIVQTVGLPSGVATDFTEIPIDSSYTLESVVSGFKTLVVKTSSQNVLVLGSNDFGKLGIGTGTEASTITSVNLGVGIANLSASGANTFVVGTDNSLWAAGDNFYGTYGNGLTTYDNSFKFTKVTE